MSTPQLLNLKEFIEYSRLSAATIHRLKKAGRIRYLQPSGKGGLLLFPLNALEPAKALVPGVEVETDTKKLSGPAPQWTQTGNMKK